MQVMNLRLELNFNKQNSSICSGVKGFQNPSSLAVLSRDVYCSGLRNYPPQLAFKKAKDEVEALFAELKAKDLKFHREATLWICRTPSGNVNWLEIGNDSAGLKHIMLRHLGAFSSWGLNSPEAVSSFIENAVKYSKPSVTKKPGDNIYNVVVNGKIKQIRVITGSNGFIVTAHPYSQQWRRENINGNYS